MLNLFYKCIHFLKFALSFNNKGDFRRLIITNSDIIRNVECGRKAFICKSEEIFWF